MLKITCAINKSYINWWSNYKKNKFITQNYFKSTLLLEFSSIAPEIIEK